MEVSNIKYHLVITEKVNFISFNKIGSRYIHAIYGMCSNKTKSISCAFSLNDDFTIREESLQIKDIIDSDNQSKNKDVVINEWNLLLTKKSKKDIVCLIRDPEKRLFSGINQELHTLFDNLTRNTFMLEVFIKSIFDEKESPKVKSNILKGIYYKAENFLKNEELSNQYKKMLFKWLSEIESEILYYPHTSHIYPFLYSFLSSGKVDLNKIKLIDIDSNSKLLDDEIKKYELPIPEKKERHSNSVFVEMLKEVYGSNELGEYNKLSKSIKHYLGMEIYFHELLKNLK